MAAGAGPGRGAFLDHATNQRDSTTVTWAQRPTTPRSDGSRNAPRPGPTPAAPATTPSAGRRPAAEIEAEGAALAAWRRPAVRLAHTDEERVILVEQSGIGWQVCLDERARLVVARPAAEQAVTHEHAARVGVGHEDRTRGRVEQDRVSRLGPDPRHGEEVAAERRQREAPHRREGAPEAVEQPPREGSQAARFDARGAGRADGPGHLRLSARGEAPRPEKAARAKRGDGARGVGPGSVLGEDGAHRDLVRCPAG